MSALRFGDIARVEVGEELPEAIVALLWIDLERTGESGVEVLEEQSPHLSAFLDFLCLTTFPPIVCRGEPLRPPSL